MTQLQKDDGTVISEQQEILKEAENFLKLCIKVKIVI